METPAALTPSMTTRWSVIQLHRSYVRAKFPNGVPLPAPAVSCGSDKTPSPASPSAEWDDVSEETKEYAEEILDTHWLMDRPSRKRQRAQAVDAASMGMAVVCSDTDDLTCRLRLSSSHPGSLCNANGAAIAESPLSPSTPLCPRKESLVGVDAVHVLYSASGTSSRTPSPVSHAESTLSAAQPSYGLATGTSSSNGCFALQEALHVFEGVLHHIVRQHYLNCPLCAPRSARSWLNASKPLSPSERIRLPSSPSVHSHQEQPRSSPMASPMHLCERRRALREEAERFLARLAGRQTFLLASRPTMYASTLESHPAMERCHALGGVGLLEALLLGLGE